MSRSQVSWRQFDFWLLALVAFLCVFGIAAIQSAIAGNAELAGSAQRQVIFAVVGIALAILLSLTDYHLWAAASRPLYLGTIVLLLALLILGNARFGSARWFSVGGLLLQPSEFAKIVLILVLADYLSKQEKDGHQLGWIVRSLLLTAGIAVCVFLQPNLSTTIVMFVLWAALLWFSGVPVKYFVAMIVIGAVVAFAAFPLLQDYQQNRVLNFLSQGQGSAQGEAYNIQQAQIAIGSGGWFGLGYGHGTQGQLRFLKVRHTDFIFSVVAEEFGFIGAVGLLAVFALVILRCFRAGRRANDTFGALIAYGVGVLILFQTVVSVGVNLGLMPATGLTLPFISYGGSSLMAFLMGIGLVESVAARRKPLSA